MLVILFWGVNKGEEMNNKQTLASFISTTREKMGLTQQGLAFKANIDLTVIENIESGQELFLATSVRQKIAKALNQESRKIKSLEKHQKLPNEVTLEAVEEIRLKIFEGKLTGNICPVCSSELICRISKMYDLENKLIKHPKARCSKCPFQIK